MLVPEPLGLKASIFLPEGDRATSGTECNLENLIKIGSISQSQQ